MHLKPTRLGTNLRMSFSKLDEALEMPNLIEVQKKSYEWFLKEGLMEVLREVSPITDFTGKIALEFIDFSIDDQPRYPIEECKEKDVTYDFRLSVKTRLINRETGEIVQRDGDDNVFFFNLPGMTESGTFVINGAERVIVSQLVRSPGIYYDSALDKQGKHSYSNTVIPYRGAWLEYETDAFDVFYVKIDKNKRVPITTLIRALGIGDGDCGTDEAILEAFGHENMLVATFGKDICAREAELNGTTLRDEALKEIYRKLHPGDPPLVETALALISNLFFDPKRYDLQPVGRYKFDKKLDLASRVLGHVLARPAFSRLTGEILAEEGATVTRELAELLTAHAVNEAYVRIESGEEVKVFANDAVYPIHVIGETLSDVGIQGKVRYTVLTAMMEEAGGDVEALKELVRARPGVLAPKHITKEDIFSSINYLLALSHGVGTTDDIDHLGNRRLRCVGELLQNQLRIGMTRMEKNVRERMSITGSDEITAKSLVNARPVATAFREFFASSPLSQFMDQNNPLAELTHKRRLSALGPGGLSRDRASFEVRDVHYTHYGRMCPIETPEGPNIGLISYLASYARISEYGFLEAPYRRVDKTSGRVTDEIVYMTADMEDNYIVAQANEPLDENGCFVNRRVIARDKTEIVEVDRDMIDFMDASPKMVVSVATAMIPFLENDDNTRALMGSNMQKQAVPLMCTESPIVATGMEYKAAVDSGAVVVAREGGTVTRVASDLVIIETDEGKKNTYHLLKFKRSNQGTCINQRPIVNVGDRIEKGQVIADGPATSNGEISLGRNALIGFMTWEGYNYEDAVLLNERLVRDDIYTSIHIEEYIVEARDTKLGPQEITREIPNAGEDALKDLDANGIVRIGTEVHPGDILVGKVTPKGETELTPEERLLRAIFGEKSREVKDSSKRLSPGESGIVVDVKVFDTTNFREISPGVNKCVRVYVAQKRKISVGDKMAGRHGNKGVVSRILPPEDMPFLADGTPLDIVLNPLGVPSRMNIGQVLEVHLGIAAKKLGYKIMTPVFDGATEKDISECLALAGMREDGKSILYDGRTGEPFDNPVTVGYMYYLKLHHLVDDKIHARSNGPYSLVTQQPLGGKAQFGGQRFGEMEVWALEAYGAAYTLQEILTVKSDDITGRTKTFEAIVKGENIPTPGIPESFKVLVKELQALALNICVLDKNGEPIDLSVLSVDDTPTPSTLEEVERIIDDAISEEDSDIDPDEAPFEDSGDIEEDYDDGMETFDEDEESSDYEDELAAEAFASGHAAEGDLD